MKNKTAKKKGDIMKNEKKKEQKKIKNNFSIIQIIPKRVLMFILIKIQMILFQLNIQP